MLVNCYAGSAANRLGYRYQINAPTLEDAIHDFAKRERVQPTHLRRRPGLLLAFRKGTKFFWVVYPHGREPDQLWPKPGRNGRR